MHCTCLLLTQSGHSNRDGIAICSALETALPPKASSIISHRYQLERIRRKSCSDLDFSSSRQQSSLDLMQQQSADSAIPKFDITATCGGSGQVEISATCIQDERAAHKQLVELWPTIKQSEASRCVQIVTTRGASKYVELLSCLQTPD